ncbi:MAG: HAD family phosphatase [Oscillatoriales cyanobacterium C42_A2020_001]|nr:HAD family phosphatase [Leptolyngbyaceae cyanobacterium C42_A2020_001]
MRSTVLSQAEMARLQLIRLIATDMDGTVTMQGKLTSVWLKMLEKLAIAGIQTVIVTGRSAGWVSGLAHYLPVAGAISENGGIFFSSNSSVESWLVPISDLQDHRAQLAQMFAQLKAEFPHLQESLDNRYRLTDWTFDVQGLTQLELEQISDRCQENGWSITYSTVQVHIKYPQQTKANGLFKVLDQYFPTLTSANLVTVGDSPNDESLFDPKNFPLSVGVANVREYGDHLKYHPTYITTAPEADGFCELAQLLIANR